MILPELLFQLLQGQIKCILQTSITSSFSYFWIVPKSHILKLKSRGQKTSESNGSLYVHMLCEETYMAREERANWRISAGHEETIKYHLVLQAQSWRILRHEHPAWSACMQSPSPSIPSTLILSMGAARLEAMGTIQFRFRHPQLGGAICKVSNAGTAKSGTCEPVYVEQWGSKVSDHKVLTK